MGAYEWNWMVEVADAPKDNSGRTVKTSPNPFTSKVRIEYHLSQIADERISIFNSRGECVESITGSNNIGDRVITWDATGLSSGIYFYSIQLNNKISTGKIIKIE